MKKIEFIQILKYIIKDNGIFYYSIEKSNVNVSVFEIIFKDSRYQDSSIIGKTTNIKYWIPKIEELLSPRKIDCYIKDDCYFSVYIENSLKIDRKNKLNRIYDIYNM